MWASITGAISTVVTCPFSTTTRPSITVYRAFCGAQNRVAATGLWTGDALAFTNVGYTAPGDGDVAPVQFAGVDVGDRATSHQQVGGAVAPRRLYEHRVLRFVRQHGLDGPVDYYGVLQAFGVTVLFEVFEVGERLGEGEAELVVGEVLGEDAARHIEGCCRAPVEGGERDREALLVVEQELPYAAVEVVEERPVTREDEVHVKVPQSLE